MITKKILSVPGVSHRKHVVLLWLTYERIKIAILITNRSSTLPYPSYRSFLSLRLRQLCHHCGIRRRQRVLPRYLCLFQKHTCAQHIQLYAMYRLASIATSHPRKPRARDVIMLASAECLYKLCMLQARNREGRFDGALVFARI